MSNDNDNDVAKSESRSEGTDSFRSEGTSSGSTKPPPGEIITPETHRPEDVKTHQYIAGVTAPGKSTFLDRMRSLFSREK